MMIKINWESEYKRVCIIISWRLISKLKTKLELKKNSFKFYKLKVLKDSRTKWDLTIIPCLDFVQLSQNETLPFNQRKCDRKVDNVAICLLVILRDLFGYHWVY